MAMERSRAARSSSAKPHAGWSMGGFAALRRTTTTPMARIDVWFRFGAAADDNTLLRDSTDPIALAATFPIQARNSRCFDPDPEVAMHRQGNGVLAALLRRVAHGLVLASIG